MFNHKTALSIAIAAVLATPMLASAALTPEGGEISPDRQYIYVGGEEGWVPRPHEYSFINGKLTHTDDRPMNTPAPSNRLPAQWRTSRRFLGQSMRGIAVGFRANTITTCKRKLFTVMCLKWKRQILPHQLRPPQLGDVSVDGRGFHIGEHPGSHERRETSAAMCSN